MKRFEFIRQNEPPPEGKMKEYKYGKPPIYFLLPVCAEECFWPACGQPADCWSRSSLRRPESWGWSRWWSWWRLERSPHSRSPPPSRCCWTGGMVWQLDVQQHDRGAGRSRVSCHESAKGTNQDRMSSQQGITNAVTHVYTKITINQQCHTTLKS